MGFPLRGSSRHRRVMRCLFWIRKQRKHLIRHLKVTPSPQGDGLLWFVRQIYFIYSRTFAVISVQERGVASEAPSISPVR